MSWATLAQRAGGYAPSATDWAEFQNNMNNGMRVKLDEYVVTTGSVQQIVFSGFDQGFKHLIAEGSLQGSAGSAETVLLCRTNGISTATYDYQSYETMLGTSKQAATGTLTGAYMGSVGTIGLTPTPGINTAAFGHFEATFFDYSDNSGSFEKTVYSRWSWKKGISAGDMKWGEAGAFIRQTASLTDLEFRGLGTITFSIGSRITLWGVPV